MSSSEVIALAAAMTRLLRFSSSVVITCFHDNFLILSVRIIAVLTVILMVQYGNNIEDFHMIMQIAVNE